MSSQTYLYSTFYNTHHKQKNNDDNIYNIFIPYSHILQSLVII